MIPEERLYGPRGVVHVRGGTGPRRNQLILTHFLENALVLSLESHTVRTRQRHHASKYNTWSVHVCTSIDISAEEARVTVANGSICHNILYTLDEKDHSIVLSRVDNAATHIQREGSYHRATQVD